ADAAADAKPRIAVVGCPVRGEADRLALIMLRDVARSAGCEVQIVPPGRFVETVSERAANGADVAACIGAVSPGELAQVAGLCKQLRASRPGVAVIVGRWGATENKPGTGKFLTDAGAAQVTWDLRQTLAAIAPEPVPP